MSSHKINRVILDFSFAGDEQSEALQKSRSLFYDKALKQLNEAFEAVKEDIYIDRFEIDLAQTSAENFETDFSEALIKTFKKHVTAKEKPVFTNNGQLYQPPVDQLLYFLVHGYWNWAYQQNSEQDIVNFTTAIFKNETQALQLFRSLHLKSRLLAERLISLASEKRTVWTLLIKALQKYQPVLLSLSQALPLNWTAKATKPGSFFFFFLSELMVSSPLQDTLQLPVLLEKIVNNSFLSGYIFSETEKNKATKIPSGQPPKKTVHLGDPLSVKSVFAEMDSALASGVIVPGLLQPDIATQLEAADNYLPADGAQKIAIQNAGLILFHPYLVFAFTELGWLTADKKFANNLLQQKAILFLQYLINGKSRQAEHELVLNKIICGWPVHLPLKRACNLSKAEKAIAADLIDSLKEHWTVVKNTSPAGIISSFVSRAGLLQRTEHGYTLQVERKTIDILLNSLPFGFSYIKFPWNEYIINTEW